ncbi:SPT3 Dosage dependent suppressor of Ty-induced promoter mutations-like protein [Entomortierella chlamydospora]|uniref:SPT3 Dosage dependent suppressor of Ty-induced promoter mutations-like protein n=1 Tax=Entomortierella chlamydospora TaxID=101097 RepID=A0A9P6SX53_9FUNG|nr:SPT3 Dosage dependent suppressor of Ty-induced promoter mutations-like protein [Entomortierella chlamydospora]KAG0009458.1 SPT3 Dosage dependent suppressor of Ty-induced promoter mutations-like protein [Entomortierella chlamydospora]
MSAYSLEARIIQKKDQLEGLSASGAIIPAPIVDEVRTGQQFLIKLQFVKNGLDHTSMFPSLRVGRRVAINTISDPSSDPEPLTLEISMHLAKSGQTKKSACAKCCHKYGPFSPILVLLDPLSPSVTDPTTYAHIDTTTGSATLLAKVICSSTDHGERGNKDRYIFEFKLKRTSSMPSNAADISSSPPIEGIEEEGETLSTCFTHAIMCSGHHKAKRAYPHQRPTKINKEGPTPKTKIVKRHRSDPNINTPLDAMESQAENLMNAKAMARDLDFQNPMAFLSDHLSMTPITETFAERPDSLQSNSISTDSQSFLSSTHILSDMMQPQQQSQQQSQQSYPKITEIRPNHGPIRKRIDVVLRGLSFRDGMIPYFGCFQAQEISVETSNLIICKAPESPLPGPVSITIYDSTGNCFSDLGQFTYTDDSETELLILQLQLRLAHRALEYMHAKATGQRGNVNDILRNIPELATSPGSGSVLMMEKQCSDSTLGADTPLLSQSMVEQGIIDTLDLLGLLPKDIDISLQLEDGSNLLHLSTILGFNKMAIRLVEEGCDFEAQDIYSLTPLMYAVLKGNETMVKTLVMAGASLTGARTPEEYYARLPRGVGSTQVIHYYLSISCTRFSATPFTVGDTVKKKKKTEIGDTEGSYGSYGEECTTADDTDESQTVKAISPRSQSPITTSLPSTQPTPVGLGLEGLPSKEYDIVTELEGGIRDMHVNHNAPPLDQRNHHNTPPLDQQSLPQFRVVQSDGSFLINTGVIRRADVLNASGQGTEQHFESVNQESGYHTGICPGVQAHLDTLHSAILPSQRVRMHVSFKLPPNSFAPMMTKPLSNSSMPMQLLRTGDSFTIELRLTTPSGNQIPMPREFVGIKFPPEMIKRTTGKPAPILENMTYALRVSIRLGEIDVGASSSSNPEPVDTHELSGVALTGSCRSCSKLIHEHKKPPPSRIPSSEPLMYPILQFYVHGKTDPYRIIPSASVVSNPGVVELRNGVCEVKAKVNCSSLHHLQRAMAKRARTRALPELRDPGYVFKFELVHPSLRTVVAQYETRPISFQSYPRGGH